MSTPATVASALISERMWRRNVPAWMLSLILHLAAVLVGSLFIRGTYLPSIAEDSDKNVSIVLVQRKVAAPTEYLKPDNSQSDTANDAAVAATPAPAATLDATEDLPPPSAPFARLPEAPGRLTSPGETIVLKPQSPGGKRRPISLLTEADKAAIVAEDAARPRAKGPSGPTAKLSLFGSEQAEGRSFVFLIDRSQSMGSGGLGAIDAAAGELALAVENLAETHKFQVIAYNQKPLYLTGREMISATPGNKKQLIEFVKNLPAFGATEHEMGIFAALKLQPDAIFLLTDGGDPMLNAGQLKLIRSAAKGTAIHCLHFGSGSRMEERSFLQTLAEYTGGSYLYVDMAERR